MSKQSFRHRSHPWTTQVTYFSAEQTKLSVNLHLDAASNLSDFFFRFHFHGLKSLPKAENLLFLSSGGVRVPEPRLLARLYAAPFCFFAAKRKAKIQLGANTNISNDSSSSESERLMVANRGGKCEFRDSDAPKQRFAVN